MIPVFAAMPCDPKQHRRGLPRPCQLSAKKRCRKRRLSYRAADCRSEVGPLPGESAVLVGRAAEMPIGCRTLVDWPVQLERAPDIGRREPEQLRQNFFELLFLDLA